MLVKWVGTEVADMGAMDSRNASCPVNPHAEILRLQDDLGHFDRNIAHLRQATRLRPWHRIQLIAQQKARQATEEALDAWLGMVAWEGVYVEPA